MEDHITLDNLREAFSPVGDKRLALIVDVDGTLVDVSSITYLVHGPKKQFDKFHEMSAHCPPIKETVDDLHQAHSAGNVAIILASGRQEKFRYLTKWWMTQNAVPYHLLKMRKNGDFRRDVVIKQEMLDEVQAAGFCVIGAIDDNPDVTHEVWRRNKIPWVKVVPGFDERNNINGTSN